MRKRHFERKTRVWDLRVIKEVCERRSLVGAAIALGVTQPAVTRIVHEVENLCGAKLFDRHARGVVPNRLGLALLSSAREILAEIASFEGHLQRVAHAEAGVVNVGALPPAAMGLMPGVMTRLSAGPRQLQLTLIEGSAQDLSARLASGEIELIIGRLADAPPRQFACEILYDEALALVARRDHPVLRGIAAASDQLARYPMVIATPLADEDIERLLASLPQRAAPALRTNSLSMLLRLLEAGDHVAIVPRIAMAADILRGTISARSLPLPHAARPAGVVRHAHYPLSEGAGLLLDALRPQIDEMTRMTGDVRPVAA